MEKIKSLILVLWAYLGEYLATSLIYLLLFLIFDPIEISSFVIKTSEHLFSKFIYLMLIASIGFYWTFYKQSESEFSKWLHKKNAHSTYSGVFLTTIAIYFSTLFLISVTDLSKNTNIAYITGWFIILASINVFTFFYNIKKLMELMIFFNSNSE
jgi:hypothetical protein